MVASARPDRDLSQRFLQQLSVKSSAKVSRANVLCVVFVNEYLILVAECLILVAECLILAVEYLILVAEYLILVPEYLILVPEDREELPI